MSAKRLLVINPNSNDSVTAGIDAAIAADRLPGTLEIECMTLNGAPFGIESDEDIAAAVPLVVERLRRYAEEYDGFVIACYSDPGLALCRDAVSKPVLGIQESAASLCASYARRFGVVALGAESIRRHVAYVRGLGLGEFHAGERPLGITVDEAANDPETLDRIVEAGRDLIDQDGAETVILGCAGLAAHRRPAEERLGVPVIDPVQAAVTLARRRL